MVDLLETHGQSGNCGFEHKLYYHNSFLLADPKEAWVLETAGQHWAAKKVNGLYSISNGITVDNEWDKASADLVDFAIAKKWCKNASDFSFSKCYSDFLYTTFSDCRKRRNRTMQLLTSRSGEISLNTMMTVLRDHGDEENYTPDRGLTGAGVCMHAGCGPVRVSQTTGSLVCHLHPESPTIFYTGTAAPCTSLYKPVWIDATLPAAASTARGSYEADSLFWKHEVLHRHMLEDYSTLIHTIQHERDTLEQEFIQKALAMALFSSEERSGFSAASYARAESMESAWLKNILSLQKHRSQKWLHKLAWQHFSKKAKMPH